MKLKMNLNVIKRRNILSVILFSLVFYIKKAYINIQVSQRAGKKTYLDKYNFKFKIYTKNKEKL
jgi:hypothetical protein